MSEPAATPGWYPTGPGQQAYWDGTQWTGDTAPLPPASGGGDDKTWAVLAHVLTLVFGFIAPLVVFLVKKDESPYVRHHAAEALNFQISVMIYAVVSFVLILVLIGLLMLLALVIGAFILTIVASVAASNGQWYRYPLTIRMVR